MHPDQLESIVVPDGALGGEAVLACIEKGLNIICVKNQNILNVSYKLLNYPNFIKVNNYLEAAGTILSFKKGINLKSIRRPLKSIKNIGFDA